MAATIYSAPKEIQQPTLSIHKYDGETINEKLNSLRLAEEKYIDEVKSWIKRAGYSGENSGEIIQFPVADGYAQYMVISMKPLRLVHIPLGDGWDFQYVNRLTAKDVQDKINGQKALEKLFGGKK